MPKFVRQHRGLVFALFAVIMSGPFGQVLLAAKSGPVPSNIDGYVTAVVDQYYRPRADALAQHMQNLQLALEQACSHPADANDEGLLSRLRRADIAQAADDAARLKGMPSHAARWKALHQAIVAIMPLANQNAERTMTRICLPVIAETKDMARGAEAKAKAWQQPDAVSKLASGDDRASISTTKVYAALIRALSQGLKAVEATLVIPKINDTSEKDYRASDLYISRVDSLHALYTLLHLEDGLDDDQFWMKNLAGTSWRTLAASDGIGGRRRGRPKDTSVKVKDVRSTLSQLSDLIMVDLKAAAASPAAK